MATYLVDASPYIFRAYFAPGPERASKAVYGFAAFLLRLIREEQPARLGVAFDESLTTSFRNDLYPPYKAHRPPPPPELEAGRSHCREMARALGAATFVGERYEADDLIASLCARLDEAVIVSSDKDLAQLVTPEITLFDFAKGLRYGPAEVVEKFGVRPDQIADLLGIAGDSIDNIPGVKGVGHKGAVALLREFGHLEELYERLDEVSSLPVRGAKSIAARLERDRENAFLSKRLATVVGDAPVAVEGLEFSGADRALVNALFDRLGFGDKLRDRIARWR